MGFGIGGPGPSVPCRPRGDKFFSPVLCGGVIGILFISLADGLGQPVANSDNFSDGDHKCEIQGVWGVGADSFVGHLVSASCLPVQLV